MNTVSDQAVTRLIKAFELADDLPFPNLTKDTILILESIYRWQYSNEKFSKLFQCGSNQRAIDFSKHLKEKMYEAGVDGSCQQWSNGRTYVDFWGNVDSGFRHKIDEIFENFYKPDTEYKFIKTTAAKKKKKKDKHEDSNQATEENVTDPAQRDILSYCHLPLDLENYEDLENDNPYTDDRYRLTEKQYITPRQRVHVGNMITFEYNDLEYGLFLVTSTVKKVKKVAKTDDRFEYEVEGFYIDNGTSAYREYIKKFTVQENDIIGIMIP